MTRDPDVRFSLANERTLLAWGRTSIAIIATGLVLARFLPSEGQGRLMVAGGVALIVSGTLLGLLAYRNYRRIDTAIRRGESIANSPLPAMLTVLIVFAGVFALILIA